MGSQMGGRWLEQHSRTGVGGAAGGRGAEQHPGSSGTSSTKKLFMLAGPRAVPCRVGAGRSMAQASVFKTFNNLSLQA